MLYVIPNVDQRPVVEGYPNAGEILPYLTKYVDGKSIPVALTETQARYFSEAIPAPHDMAVALLDD